MAVSVEVLSEATDEAVSAVTRLLPQLSRSASELGREGLRRIINCPATFVLIARQQDGGTAQAAPAAAGRPEPIIGMLTLAVFPLPTGVRAWIEDVVVDESARGQGAGAALTLAALRLAGEHGARTVDLTSRPSREAAGRLYERLGFERRDSRLYRYDLTERGLHGPPGQGVG